MTDPSGRSARPGSPGGTAQPSVEVRRVPADDGLRGRDAAPHRLGRDRLARRRLPDLRPGRRADAAACAAIWAVSIGDYERRLNRPVIDPDLGPITRLIEHLATSDPGGFWVATRPSEGADAGDTSGAMRAGESAGTASLAEGADAGERIVGFANAIRRGDLWFLSLLFVLPAEQGRGLGTSLLGRVFPGGRLPRGAWSGEPPLLGTATDSVQPVSNALYARLGIVPRAPVLRIVGRPLRPGSLPPLPAGVRALTLDDPAAVEALDRELLGFERAGDHRWFSDEGRRGYRYLDPTGATLGYGYLSSVGRIGPVAVRDPALLAPIVAHLLDAHVPAGASALSIAGDADELIRILLGAGFRLDGFPTLLCWNRPFLPLDRYLVASLALP